MIPSPRVPKGPTALARRLDSANRLVQETLARHGLGAAPGPAAPRPSPSEGSARQPFGALPEGLAARLHAALPGHRGPGPADGTVGAMRTGRAGVDRQTYACAAGSRDYCLHVPASAADAPTGLIVMLHGCTQTPEDFAAGTAMNALADRHGFLVLYPAQARGANAQSCWNWFSRGDQHRDRGEPAILAGMTRQTLAAHGVPADKVFVAGLSAGGAMAVILGETWPDLFAGVGVHSGLPYGAARDVASAFAAMGGTPLQDTARPRPGGRPRTIVFHGAADATVHPVNGALTAREALPPAPGPQIETVEEGKAGGRAYRRQVTQDPDGRVAVEHWVIDGLGHAWSGGAAAGSYTDPDGPDASAEMVRFFLS